MLIALASGYTIGAVLAILACRSLLRAIAGRVFPREDQRRWIMWVGGIFAAISFAPATFLAMMIGGPVGGTYDQALAAALGLGESGHLFVLSTRLAVVVVVTVAVNAVLGAMFGFLIARGLTRTPAA